MQLGDLSILFFKNLPLYWRTIDYSDLSMTCAEDNGITGNLLVLFQVNDVANLDCLTLHLTVPSLLHNTHNPLVCSVIFLVSTTIMSPVLTL